MTKCKRSIVVFDLWDEDEHPVQIVKAYNDPVKAADYIIDYCKNVRKDREWTKVNKKEQLEEIKSYADVALYGWRSGEKEKPDIISMYGVEVEDMDDLQYIEMIMSMPVKPVLSANDLMWECGACHAPVSIYKDDPEGFDLYCRKCGSSVDWDSVLSEKEANNGQTSER